MNAKLRLFVTPILIALLSGCSGKSAVDVAGRFWKAVNDGDLEKAQSYATKETAASLTINNNGDAEVDVEFGATSVEGEHTIIETRMVTRMGDVTQNVEMKTVLAQEDGEWKVDVMSTMMSMFGGAAQEMMQGMTDAMGQAMQDMGAAMMEGMQKGFAQFGAPGIPNSDAGAEYDVQPEEHNYRIKFGYMKQRMDGTHYVHKRTKRIPMRTGKFMWGYTIEGDTDPFTTYSVAYTPDGPPGGEGSRRLSASGEVGWESNTATVTNGYFYQVYNNYPGDEPSERKLAIYINDRLVETIEFTVGNP